MIDLEEKWRQIDNTRTGTYMMNNYIGEDAEYCKGFTELIDELFKK